MLSRYNPIEVEAALQAASVPPPFPPAADRAAWQEIRSAIGEDKAARIVAQAGAEAQRPVPALPATLYLDCQRTGERKGYEIPYSVRRSMLSRLALAECLEGQGRFLDPLLDVAWAICEESSWAYPAHQITLADVERPVLDLGAAMTALDLAELDLLLGSVLDPALGRRLRYEINRRCLTPYLTRHDYFWLHNHGESTVNNWTAVCSAGVVGAALYLEPDRARLAEIVARAARSLDDYLSTFDPDGGSTEGPGYWAYGFGYYVLLAHLVEQRTQNQVSFLEGDLVRQIAQFPLRTMLSSDHYVNFSDAPRDIHFHPALLCYLGRRLDLPDLLRLAGQQPADADSTGSLAWELRRLVWRPTPEPLEKFIPTRHDWFRGMMWMIARYDPVDPNALVLAAKGGHNDEMHNHNDVGTFIVHLGGESMIADVGCGRYTRAYFSPTRYEHFAASALGHSVPVPNGQVQRPGRNYAAALREHRADATIDLLALEMKDAYPAESDLASLWRTIALHREPPRGRVELVDEVRFATAPGHLESVLTTFGQVEIGADAVLLRGEHGALRIGFDAATVTPRVEWVPQVDLAEGPRDVQRVVFALSEPAREAVIRLDIQPAG
ncbi:MAG TPA: heparinase II/III family protein [Chthonomonadaceae bacterium]|nr:heparinase II/III family protein [Chthonomonadaceae bacterium]